MTPRQVLDDIMYVRNEILSRPWDEQFKKKSRYLIDSITKHGSSRNPMRYTGGRRYPADLGHPKSTQLGGGGRPQAPRMMNVPVSIARDRSYTSSNPPVFHDPGRDSVHQNDGDDTNTRTQRSSSFSALDTATSGVGNATDATRATSRRGGDFTKYLTTARKEGEGRVQLKTIEDLCGDRLYGVAYKRMQDSLGCFRQDNTVLLMHAAEARAMEPSPHILTIGRCSLLNFKLLPPHQARSHHTHHHHHYTANSHRYHSDQRLYQHHGVSHTDACYSDAASLHQTHAMVSQV